MAVEPVVRVMVVGAGLSGRSELVRTAVFGVSSAYQIERHENAPNEVAIETEVGSFVLTVNTWLAKLAFPSVEVALQDQRIVAEVAELSRADSLLFVLDARVERRAANLRALQTLQEHLARLERAEAPVVFFMNTKASVQLEDEGSLHRAIREVVELDKTMSECAFLTGTSSSDVAVRDALAACRSCVPELAS